MFGIDGVSHRHGVERITLGKRVLGLLPMTVHAYRVGSTLIDAGPPNRVALLDHHVGLQDVTDVVLTHHHEDHVGAGPQLAGLGARVHAPADAIEPLRDPPELEPYQHRVWGAPEPLEARPVGDVVETPDLRLEVHPVPGHSPDHVAYLEPERGWLFAGDAYLPPRDTLRADEDLAGFLEGLETMAALDAEVLFPGHGSTVEQPGAAIEEVLARFEELLERTRELRDEGYQGSGLRRRLLGREGLLRYYTGGHYAKANLAEQLVELADEAP